MTPLSSLLSPVYRTEIEEIGLGISYPGSSRGGGPAPGGPGQPFQCEGSQRKGDLAAPLPLGPQEALISTTFPILLFCILFHYQYRYPNEILFK